jgi:ADP-ribose pyrophosphatase
MNLRPWKKLKQLNKISNKWWSYHLDEVELPNGKKGEYHYVHTNGASMVIPVLKEGKIQMVKQFRYLANRESLEFPCGSVKDGSTYEETAKHELAEESGVEAQQLQLIGSYNPYNGVTDEMCNVYVAKILKSVSVPHDDTEEFERVLLSKSEIEEKIKSGEIWDGMSLAAWLIAKDLL